MANLNTDTSVVDYLKSTGGDFSFSGRAKKAVELGIVKSIGDYSGSALQNTSLLSKLKGAVPAAPTNVSNAGQSATDFINAKQDEDISVATKQDEPPTRSVTTDLVGAFKELTGKSSLVPTGTTPAAPNFEQTFQDLRKQYGVDVLETNINDLDTQEQELQAQLRISRNAEIGKPVALNVIEGRVGEQERNFNERIDTIQRQKARAVAQLQTANDAIENLMTFKKMDYDVAKDAYNTEFSQNLQLFDTIRGVYSLELTEKDRAQDTARANLQIIYNSIQDGEADIATLDPKLETKINKLELEAGLPQGFFKSLQSKKPDSKILSTTTRTTSGKKYADIIYQNSDGSLSTQQVLLGSSNEGSGGNESESDLERSQRSKTIQYFEASGIGGDGYTSPEAYIAARKAWVTDVKGATPSEFDEIFAKDYLNPESYDKANVSLF